MNYSPINFSTTMRTFVYLLNTNHQRQHATHAFGADEERSHMCSSHRAPVSVPCACVDYFAQKGWTTVGVWIILLLTFCTLSVYSVAVYGRVRKLSDLIIILCYDYNSWFYDCGATWGWVIHKRNFISSLKYPFKVSNITCPTKS